MAGEDRLYGIEANGTSFWEYTLNGSFYAQQSYPTVGADGVYFVGRGDGSCYVLLNQFNGNLLASDTSLGGYDDSVALSTTDRVHVSFDTGIVWSANYNSGYLFTQWANGEGADTSGELFDTWDGRFTIDRIGNIYRGWIDDNVYAVAPSGTTLWSPDVGFSTNRAVVIGPDQTLYVPGGTGMVALQVE